MRSTGFTEFSWIFLGFTGFYWVLLGFTGFYWVLPSFTEFNVLLQGFKGFLCVWIGYTLGYTWYYRVFTEFWWIFLCFIGLKQLFRIRVQCCQMVRVTEFFSFALEKNFGSIECWAQKQNEEINPKKYGGDNDPWFVGFGFVAKELEIASFFFDFFSLKKQVGFPTNRKK